MALKKKITTKFGGQAEYWKITKYEFDIEAKRGTITVKPFMSEAARKKGHAGIDSEDYISRIEDIVYYNDGYKALTTQDFTDYFSGNANATTPQRSFYTVMYEYLKNCDPFFKGAEDI